VLAVIGREFPLGSGKADLLAVELGGRLVVIEVKLAQNAEARRAVVAQIFAYAAYLDGMDPAALEREVVGRYLRGRGYETLADALVAVDQGGMFDAETFTAGLAESLRDGRFRLVLVLDAVPNELARLVAYLESATDKLLIDLIAVSAYEVDGTRLIVPQRVQAERRPLVLSAPASIPERPEGRLSDGADEFIASIDAAQADQQALLRKLAAWASDLKNEGLVRLSTFVGKSARHTLVPRLVDEGVGLVTLWNHDGGSISFHRSVFARRAPGSIARVEAIIAPKMIGGGNNTNEISDELLVALTDAYRKAAGRPVRRATPTSAEGPSAL